MSHVQMFYLLLNKFTFPFSAEISQASPAELVLEVQRSQNSPEKSEAEISI